MLLDVVKKIKNNKNLIIFVSVIYLSILLITMCGIFPSLVSDFIAFDISNLPVIMLVISILFYLLFGLMISIFINSKLTIIYLFFMGIILGLKSFYKDKVDITDKKSDEYYRDLLKEYSVGMLGYINDFNSARNDIAASVLMLELKKKIEIKEKIKVIDESYVDLSEEEIYLLNCLSNNSDINIIEYENKIINGCEQSGLLIKNENFKKKFINKIIIFVILIILLELILKTGLFNMSNIFNLTELSVATDSTLAGFWFIVVFMVVLLMAIVSFGYICYLVVYLLLNAKNPFIRGKKGKELNKKLSGLKNFLKDFSAIHEKEHKELKIWEDYLIYSVIFEQNNNIRDEILRKINL